ncbi:MAG: metallophosphoesterase [Bacteroidales bacterium]|nr:metallophosphoesterase [Candidatus Liminaster caballi]
MEQPNKNPILLIIPDVHGRTFWKRAIMQYPELPTVFLGDYLDPYTSIEGILPSDALFEFQDILQYKNENPDRVTLLLGNHDIHYFDYKINSSRKDWQNHEKIAQLFSRNLSHFQLTKLINAGGKQFLLSHAGIIPGWIERHFEVIDLSDTKRLADLLNEQLADLKKFKVFVTSALMDVSASRWGTAEYPSIVWADVEDHQLEKHRLPNVYQVFGHTRQDYRPIIANDYANLDCRKAFLLMEDGTIEQVTA